MNWVMTGYLIVIVVALAIVEFWCGYNAGRRD